MVGIDLGNKFLKVCKIIDNSSNKNSNKKSLSIVSAMQDISSFDNIGKKNAITSLLQRLECEEENVFLAVSGTDIINNYVSIKQNDKKFVGVLKDKIMQEIKASLTEELNKAYLSYSIIRNVSDKEMDVLASIVPMKKIDTKFSLINSIEKIMVRGVTLESFAVANSFIKFGPNYKKTETIILLNIGHKITNMIVLNNQNLVFVKDIDFGGHDITKEISSIYQIPEKVSEEIKRRNDIKQSINFDIKNVFKKSLSPLVETVFRTIEYCATRQLIVSVDRIVITGGCVLTEKIDSFMEETLGIPVEIWNPLENIELEGYVNKYQGCFLPVALGLALEKEKK